MRLNVRSMLGVWERPNVPQSLYTSEFEACRVRLLGLFEKYSFFCSPTGEILRPREENIFP